MGVAGLLVSAGFLAIGPASAAQASPANCAGGVNGFIDIPDSLQGTAVNGSAAVNDYSPYGTASYALNVGTVSGQVRGWGRLQPNLNSGEVGKVWMDVSNNAGSSWIQCGPFTTTFQGVITTPAYPTSSSSSRVFRVCAQVNNSTISCSGWW
ncbi:hypothetical protein [Actinokineospora sp. NBRC 105648]|uniref:hypothetical protein n=1 Tax=Actinokineospora sp. NBRC 105648 TaxID=3032206 RepID=UPI0024A32883|nr:hypothetical protein [Actinokineospora sp. NBRC 105648]GLZ37089.1 hypothetical protein Acsp05_07140 [Actinokineospora sp. NBRC 105648]